MMKIKEINELYRNNFLFNRRNSIEQSKNEDYKDVFV